MSKADGESGVEVDPKGSRSDYFKEYYETNRSDINTKRMRRYHTDPEHKERVLKSSRRYRDKNRTAPKIRIPRFSTPMVKEAGDGNEIKLFSVGAFAVFLSRSVQAISHWEKGRVLPHTPYRDGRGHRHYTPNMMYVVKEVVGDRRRLFPVAGIFDRIEAGWKELGIPVGAKNMVEALAKTVVYEDDVQVEEEAEAV